MATLDFGPMFRSTVGFDQIPHLLSQALERDSGYPPYDIESLGPNSYRIVMAVAGFSRDDIEIVKEENRVTVRGAMKNDGEKTYLYRGLASRAFNQVFDVADYVDVTSATLDNGLLIISLKRELPEALKPRTVPIGVEGATATESLSFDKRAA